MAASIKAYGSYGATEATTRTNHDTTGGSAMKFNRSDDNATTAPIPVPTTATSTNYSWYKNLYLYCDSATGAGTTISNLKISYASGPTSGLGLYFKASSSYTQAASGNKPTDSTSVQSGTAPSTYTLMSTTPQVYDATGGTSTNATRVGQFCLVVLGVDNSYAGGGNSNTTLPNLVFTYDEA